MADTEYDAVVVGSGPNGLMAAATLGAEGAKVLVLEAQETLGGGARSAELTLPGFVHDTCSTVWALGLASKAMRALPLEEHGVEWCHPEIPVANPLDGRPAALLHRSVDETADGLGADALAYRKLMGPLVGLGLRPGRRPALAVHAPAPPPDRPRPLRPRGRPLGGRADPVPPGDASRPGPCWPACPGTPSSR